MNIINIEHIEKIFGDKVIFADASLGIQQGDKIGIIGINGTGKSTLLRIIAGEEEPDRGEVIRQNGLKILYLPQNPEFPREGTLASYALKGDPQTQTWRPLLPLFPEDRKEKRLWPGLCPRTLMCCF